MLKKDPIETKKDVIIFFGIFVVMMLGFILTSIYQLNKHTKPKVINTKIVANLQAELKEKNLIMDMKFYFYRPNLNFEFKVKEEYEYIGEVKFNEKE